MKATVVTYNKNKYEPGRVITSRNVFDVKSIRIASGSEEADTIERTNESATDRDREYLVIELLDGGVKVYNNSESDVIQIN